MIPVFNILNSCESILKRRRDFPLFDSINRYLIPLDEALIFDHMVNMDKAKTCFEQYYQNAVANYRDKIENGTQHYLRKSQSIVFGRQEIIAEEDGIYTVYDASDI